MIKGNVYLVVNYLGQLSWKSFYSLSKNYILELFL